MLTVKQKALDKKKVVLYMVFLVIVVGGIAYSIISEQIRRTSTTDSEMINEVSETAPILEDNQSQTEQAVSQLDLSSIEVGAFSKIANDQKFENLHDIYKDDGKTYKMGKTNPFLP